MSVSLKTIFDPFSDDFRAFEQTFTEIMRSDVKLVDQVASYLVKHKGKQFRPALVLVAARAIGEPTRDTYVTAAVVELLHTASLVHDDVLDEAELRRGFTTIHKIWKNKIAILMGDYLLSKSLIAATEIGSLDIMHTVATVAKRLIKGAMFEIQKSRSVTMSEEDYYRVIADKTASLISACCELGALTVGASDPQRQAMRDFGEHLGVAFQIKDDLLDYEASSGILGKPALADVQDKKVTLPLILALKQADDGEGKRILKAVKKGIDKQKLAWVLDFVQRYDGIARARERAEAIKQEAVDALAVLPDSPAKQSLIDLADFVVNRKK